VFGGGTDPLTDLLPKLAEQGAMGVRNGAFNQSLAVDTPLFW
jgi:hypothetical protein